MDQEESLDRALADLAMIQSAYSEEIQLGSIDDDEGGSGSDELSTTEFPLRFTLQLQNIENSEIDALITMELTEGYPIDTGVQIVSYRSLLPKNKARLDETVAAIRRTANECRQEEMEGGMACCSIAFEVWNDCQNNNDTNNNQSPGESQAEMLDNVSGKASTAQYNWITGEPLIDKKSAFQAHVCQIFSEKEVKVALQQLMDSNSKLHKATHNMFAYRLTEKLEDGRKVLKHDNDDDGEDAAGARLAHLLEMRKENCIFVVVSRWYGGIKLGPKRFAHINNVARELLQDCHDKNLFNQPKKY